MKNKLCLLVSAVLLLTADYVRAQGTAFTYQGHLKDGANSANGSYDLRFAIWDATSAGNRMSDAVMNDATLVSNGLFTVTLDFGPVFDGNARWIEIGVRTNGGDVFSILSPRQALTAAPYAIYAGGVNAAGINGAITSNMLAPGAAAANLAATGQSAVPSGGVIFSSNDNDTNLTASGFTRIGGYVNAPNLWRHLATDPALAARAGHTAVWTGNKMVVWGGYCGGQPSRIYFTDGGSYDPVSNAWSTLTTDGTPAGREDFTSVWTGNEMIIWGGYTYDTSYHYLTNGARYNPLSNGWAMVATNNAPGTRNRHTAVWTGTEMIVWGGICFDGVGYQFQMFNDGGRFDPASNRWTSINPIGAPAARISHTAVWTGSEMIIWGGQNGSGLDVWLNDGKRYNPTTDTWATMSSVGAPSARSRHTAVWTGTEMIVWGPSEAGSRYNPTTDSWFPMDYLFEPAGRIRGTSVWTGREMIIWGGDGGTARNDGGSYDPSSNTWTPMATAPRAPAGRMNHSAVWTGSEMIIYGGEGCFNDTWSCTPPKPLYMYLRP